MERLKERQISLEERQKTTDELRLRDQKLINLSDNAPNQPFKFKSKNWVEINYHSRGMYNTNRQVGFKTSMLKSNLCNYCDGYILVKRIIKAPNKE